MSRVDSDEHAQSSLALIQRVYFVPNPLSLTHLPTRNGSTDNMQDIWNGSLSNSRAGDFQPGSPFF